MCKKKSLKFLLKTDNKNHHISRTRLTHFRWYAVSSRSRVTNFLEPQQLKLQPEQLGRIHILFALYLFFYQSQSQRRGECLQNPSINNTRPDRLMGRRKSLRNAHPSVSVVYRERSVYRECSVHWPTGSFPEGGSLRKPPEL